MTRTSTAAQVADHRAAYLASRPASSRGAFDRPAVARGAGPSTNAPSLRIPAVGRPATDKQVTLLTRLLAEKQHPYGSPDLTQVTTRGASAMIDALFAAPRVQTAPAAAAKPGYYRSGDEFFVVVENKAGTHTYAKRLTIAESGRASWEYAPGVGRTLAGLVPLTVADAAAWGHAHGVCAICCRRLTDPVSVERGIGPVCASRLA